MRGDVVMGRSAALGWMGSLRGLPRRADGLDWLIVAAAALGAALVMARALPHGVGLSHDSLFYIEVARNVLAGEGIVNYDGGIHTTWPPGYPLLLAAAGLGIIDPHSIAGPLNAALFGLMIFAVGRYMRRRLEMGFLALWACVAIALALPLAELARFALPDMAFILFTTLALMQTDRALRDDSRAALAWAAIFCALAWQMRYIGAAVPALIGLALLLAGGMPLARRLRRAALFGAIAGAPMALWLLRNYLVEGRWLSKSYDGVGFSLTATLRDGAQSLAGWGQPLPGWFAVIVFAALMLTLGIVIARGNRSCVRRACLIFGGFGLAYAALLVAAIMQGTTWDGVRPRYVAAIYIPLVVVATFALDGLFGWMRDRRAAAGAGGTSMISAFARGRRANRLLAIALGGGLCAWIGVQAIENADHIARANSGELYLGYAERRWIESETMRYLRDNLSGAVIYTNDPLPAHFHSGGNADYYGLFGRALRDTANPWRLIRLVARNHGSYAVWLDDGNPPGRVNVINMRAREGLEPVAEFADGAVFRLNGEYTPTPGSSPHFNAYSVVARGEAARLSSGGNFEVYIHQDTLIYFKRPCELADVQARFFLHIFPENVADLPDVRRGYRFENLDFEFKRRGALFEDNCVALMALPRYESERIRTGQYDLDGEGALWESDVAGTAARRFWQAHKAATDGDYDGAAARSNFDIYLDDDAESGALVYVKERCAADDTRARFFLHVYPDDAADLSADGARHGFDNLDFQFAEYGADLGEVCVAARELPQYGVERARTGQYVIVGDPLWEAEVAVSARRRYRQAHRAANAGNYGGAAAQSNFDIYLDDDAESKELVYVKERCAADDTQARFFLHIIPSDAADLPADRREQGFDNLDFGFAEYGVDLGGACVAVRELPEYEVERVRTGQHVSGEGALWRVEFGVGEGE